MVVLIRIITKEFGNFSEIFVTLSSIFFLVRLKVQVVDIHIMTEESEIFRITNSHTYHSALKSEKKYDFREVVLFVSKV